MFGTLSRGLDTVEGRFFIPQTDIVENKESLVITMDLPGVKKDKIGE